MLNSHERHLALSYLANMLGRLRRKSAQAANLLEWLADNAAPFASGGRAGERIAVAASNAAESAPNWRELRRLVDKARARRIGRGSRPDGTPPASPRGDRRPVVAGHRHSGSAVALRHAACRRVPDRRRLPAPARVADAVERPQRRTAVRAGPVRQRRCRPLRGRRAVDSQRSRVGRPGSGRPGDRPAAPPGRSRTGGDRRAPVPARRGRRERTRVVGLRAPRAESGGRAADPPGRGRPRRRA